MAEVGLIDIKRRIKSIENTRKITKAMGLVSTSKLRKARGNLKINDKFFNETKEIIKDIYYMMNVFSNSIYLKGNSSKKKLYILLGSDTGLCGGYNINLVLSLKEKIIKNEEEASVICVGKKVISYVKRYGIDILFEYLNIGDNPNLKDMIGIYKKALNFYKEGEYGEINVVYTSFISPISQEVKIEKLLPFEEINIKKDYYYIETNEDEELEKSLDFYIIAKLLNSILNAKTSEEAQRMTAMNGATKNSDDLIEKLKSKYNRIRQSAITQEIAEIVGGAEAQK